jgi:hypothetical protein
MMVGRKEGGELASLPLKLFVIDGWRVWMRFGWANPEHEQTMFTKED